MLPGQFILKPDELRPEEAAKYAAGLQIFLANRHSGVGYVAAAVFELFCSFK